MKRAFLYSLGIILLFAGGYSKTLIIDKQELHVARFRNYYATYFLLHDTPFLFSVTEVLEADQHTGFTWKIAGETIPESAYYRGLEGVPLETTYRVDGKVMARSVSPFERNGDAAVAWRTMEGALMVARDHEYPDDITPYRSEVFSRLHNWSAP